MSSESMDFFETHFSGPEMSLLLACCRRIAGNMGEREWSERIAAPFDEKAFSLLCRENRLTLAVDKMLVGPYRSRFSHDFTDGFGRETRKHVLAQLRIAKSMLDIHRSFRAGNIRHLFLKGPALNGILHGGDLLRCSRDLDILIEPPNLREADSLLAQLGYDTISPRRDIKLRSSIFRMRRKDVSFRKNGEGPVIELHWKTDNVETILNRGVFDWDLDIAHVPIHNESLPVMEDYHNCLYLCLHAAKHHWKRLQWLLDIALLLQRRGMDADRLLDLAGRYGLRNVVLEAYSLCRRLLKVDFGSGDRISWDKHGSSAALRFHLASRPVSKWTNLSINYQRGLLYPMSGPREGFWFQWSTERIIGLARKAAAWKTSRGITTGSSNPR